MKKLAFALGALAALFLAPTHPANAATPTFAVQTIQPANQIDPDAQFYKLLLKPQTKYSLQLKVSNYTEDAHRYTVTINRARNNDNGEIDYTAHGLKAPDSLQYNIEKLFAKSKQTVKIAPHSTRTLTMTYTAPDTAIKGILLGAVRVTSDENAALAAGMASNVAYITPIQMQATKTLPHLTPSLQFESASVRTNATGSMITAHMENPLPAVQAEMAIAAKLYKGKKVVLQRALTARLAPNAKLPMSLSHSRKQLKAGKYRLDVSAKLPSGKSWHYSEPVTIKDPVVKTTPASEKTAKPAGMPAWAIAALLAIVAALGGGAWYLWRKQR